MASTPALRYLRINRLQLGVTEHEFVLISICSVRIKEFMVGIMVSCMGLMSFVDSWFYIAN